jgi:hypothetical protein
MGVVSASVRNRKGLSFAPVRPTPAPVIPIALAAVLLLAGCSRKADTVVGNERLIRGPGGLGYTSQFGPTTDQDTYMAPDTAAFSRNLLVGQSGTFQARTFMTVRTWILPDTNLTGFTVDSVFFQIDQTVLRVNPLSLTIRLSETTTGWDSSTVVWPGPPEGLALGSTTYDFLGPLRINMGVGAFTFIKQWAHDPSLLPGLMLQAPGGTKVGAFKNLTGTIRVKYKYLSGALPESAFAITHVAQEFYLNSPITPAPTGADTALMLGGGYEAAVAVRVPIPPSTPGFSLNEGLLVLHVSDTFASIDGVTFSPGHDSTSVRIDAYRIRNDWTESTTDVQSLGRDLIPFAFLINQIPVKGDSLEIPVPDFLVREWTLFPDRNKGILVVIKSANVNPGLFVASKESQTPPLMRLAYTSPPPYRF